MRKNRVENSYTQNNHFIAFRLEGGPSNQSAIGTWVKVTVGGTTQLREVKAGRSHNGVCSTLVQHFGLGTVDHVDTVQVFWPSGNVQSFGPLDAESFYRLSEGDDTPYKLDW